MSASQPSDLRASVSAAGPRDNGLRAMLTPDNFKWLMTALVIPLVTWLVPLGYSIAVTAYGKAQAEIDKAKEERLRAEQELLESRRADITQMTPLIAHLSADPASREYLVALRILGALKRARHDDEGIVQVYEAARAESSNLRTDPDVEKQKLGIAMAEALAPASTNLTGIPTENVKTVATVSTVPSTSVRPDRAYIQIYSESQRSAALMLAEQLRARNIPVPGIENVIRTNPDNPNILKYAQKEVIAVRYYHPEDRKAAEFVAGVVGAAQPGQRAPVVQYIEVKNSGAAVVEIWLPCGSAEGCVS